MNPHRRHPFIFSSAMLVYVFLYAPIVVLVLFSFNASRANITFEGFVSTFSDKTRRRSGTGLDPRSPAARPQ